ncbi:MAG: hypothetical protein IJ501_06605 [Bacilli bacterium]|nr:hypothetical protein [Bacilli bacterium]
MKGTSEKLVQWLFNQDRTKIFEIKEFKEKRSLSQNAYAWKLITQIGDILRKSKEEVYLQMLKDYGQSEIVSILSSINPKGYFKYYEEVGIGIVNSKEFTHYKIFKGSSEFDSREMTIFIDGIIQECNQLGIPTLTPNEIQSLRLN